MNLVVVNLITGDLLSNDVFKKTPGREGYEPFPKFEQSLLHGLDYKDLHKWLKEHITLWGSIYQREKWIICPIPYLMIKDRASH